MTMLIAALLVASSLYEQAVERVLHERFGAVEYIAIDVETKQVIASNWLNISEPISAGSLIKPFLAVNLPPDRYLNCTKGCWIAGGHGRLNLREAIAFSCNQYFLQSDSTTLTRVPGASGGADAGTLLGLRGDFRIAPLVLVQEYVEVVRDVKAVREGMRLAVLRGTATAVKADALAKTGRLGARIGQRGKETGW